MRTRDIYATLLELVPNLVARRDGIITEWNRHADPVWRRGDAWVRVESPTGLQLLVIAGRGDETVSERVHLVSGTLQPVAQDVASLLDQADAPAVS